MEDFVHYCREGGQSSGHTWRMHNRYVARNRYPDGMAREVERGAYDDAIPEHMRNLAQKYLAGKGKNYKVTLRRGEPSCKWTVDTI